MLERIWRYAEFSGLAVAASFRKALEKERSGELPPWLRLQSDEESTYLRAILLILRDSDFAKLRPRLRKLIEPAFQAAESAGDEDLDLARELRRIEAELEAQKADKPRREKKPEN